MQARMHLAHLLRPRPALQVVGTACERLTCANVPHNLFIADSGARVFLYPNAFSERKVRGRSGRWSRGLRRCGLWCTAHTLLHEQRS